MNKLNNIPKKYLLAGGTVIMVLVCWQLALKKTWDAWQLNRQLQAQLGQVSAISNQPGYLNRENERLDRVIATYRQDSTGFRNNAVNRVTDLAEEEHVKITIVPADDVMYHSPHLILQKITFEGNFPNLLRLADKLQAQTTIGVIRSITWKTQKTTGGNKPRELAMELWLEICQK